ncbi:MAG: hypothetical protein WC505_07665 [Patescibacteria group bacterium]
MRNLNNITTSIERTLLAKRKQLCDLFQTRTGIRDAELRLKYTLVPSILVEQGADVITTNWWIVRNDHLAEWVRVERADFIAGKVRMQHTQGLKRIDLCSSLNNELRYLEDKKEIAEKRRNRRLKNKEAK